MPKRAKITDEAQYRKQTAIDKLVGSSPTPDATPEPAPPPEKPKGERTYKPTSIYLDDNQLDKLDDLAHEYRKRTRKRTNRNEIMRALVDHTSIEDIINVLRS